MSQLVRPTRLVRLISLLTCLLPASAALGQTTTPSISPRAYLQSGESDVSFEPLRREGSFTRSAFVFGVPRQRIIEALPGPATGPTGFSPGMVSVTPPEEQYRNGHLKALKTRPQGMPEALGATVEAWPTPDGMRFRMSEGYTAGEFTIVVGPERTLSDGDLEVKVTEAGSFTVMKEAPKSPCGVPAYLFSNLTPFGWAGQTVGGAGVCKGHLMIFDFEGVLRRRLGLR